MDLAALTDAELKRLLRQIQAEIEFRAETRVAQLDAENTNPGKGNSNQAKPGKGKGRK